jgi:hypothetical protein
MSPEETKKGNSRTCRKVIKIKGKGMHGKEEVAPAKPK